MVVVGRTQLVIDRDSGIDLDLNLFRRAVENKFFARDYHTFFALARVSSARGRCGDSFPQSATRFAGGDILPANCVPRISNLRTRNRVPQKRVEFLLRIYLADSFIERLVTLQKFGHRNPPSRRAEVLRNYEATD